jgi:hypothetical protein
MAKHRIREKGAPTPRRVEKKSGQRTTKQLYAGLLRSLSDRRVRRVLG